MLFQTLILELWSLSPHITEHLSGDDGLVLVSLYILEAASELEAGPKLVLPLFSCFQGPKSSGIFPICGNCFLVIYCGWANLVTIIIPQLDTESWPQCSNKGYILQLYNTCLNLRLQSPGEESYLSLKIKTNKATKTVPKLYLTHYWMCNSCKVNIHWMNDLCVCVYI